MTDQPAPTEQQVIEFLRSNPDLLVRHPDLLADLTVPHEAGGAVSLLERQAGVLRTRNNELHERLERLVAVARDNDVLFEKTRQVVLALLEARDLGAVSRALSASILDSFGLAAMTLVLFDREFESLPPRVLALSSREADTQIGGLVRGRRTVCGVLRPEELRCVFRDQADAVGSAAIVPLAWAGGEGLLAIGAREPHHFRSGMDTLFVSHIGEVLARCLGGLLPDAMGGRAQAGA